jgi:hypothetical protein
MTSLHLELYEWRVRKYMMPVTHRGDGGHTREISLTITPFHLPFMSGK